VGKKRSGRRGGFGWGDGRCANVINIIFIAQKYADERSRTKRRAKPNGKRSHEREESGRAAERKERESVGNGETTQKEIWLNLHIKPSEFKNDIQNNSCITLLNEYLSVSAK